MNKFRIELYEKDVVVNHNDTFIDNHHYFGGPINYTNSEDFLADKDFVYILEIENREESLETYYFKNDENRLDFLKDFINKYHL